MTTTRPRDRSCRRGAPRARGRPLRVQARRRRPGRDARAPARRAAHRRPRAARGRPRPGQDADRAHAGDRARRQLQPHPVHARPRARRPRRHAASGSRATARSRPSSAPCSPTCCSPTRSTARPPRCSPRCSRSCRSTRSPIGGETHRVPEPYLVLATQNPIESEGTYDLPEAQVDRFLFKLVVDYPDDRGRDRRRRPRLGADAAARSRAVEIDDAARPPAGRARGVRRPLHHRLRGVARRRDAPPRRATAWPTSSR